MIKLISRYSNVDADIVKDHVIKTGILKVNAKRERDFTEEKEKSLKLFFKDEQYLKIDINVD